MVPYGGICLIWEVADLQLLSSYFSDDDDKQGFCVFPGKALHASKRRPLHGLAFLPEAAATQEGPEAIRPSLYSGDNSWSQHVRLLLRAILGTDPPIFSERMSKVASTGGSLLDVSAAVLYNRGRLPQRIDQFSDVSLACTRAFRRRAWQIAAESTSATTAWCAS